MSNGNKISKATLREYDNNAKSTSSAQQKYSRHREYSILIEKGENIENPQAPLVMSWRTVLPSTLVASPNKILDSTVFQSALSNLQYKTKRILSDLFLPVGYPNSVREGYLQYQFYDSLQGLCSYLRGVVCTSAVLTATGVGDAEASAISAAVQWATKDGLGMIGGLIFSYHASSHFDSHVKEFRLFADVINDVGLTLDMIAPHLPRDKLLYVASCATLCRVMCGMAAGATKGSITQHFAKGNMADLNAKEGTQETLVSLLGMICGITLARYLQMLEKDTDIEIEAEKPFNQHYIMIMSWGIFSVLTVVHVWANYVGVKNLRLRTLNRERAEVALGNLIAAGASLVQREGLELKQASDEERSRNRIKMAAGLLGDVNDGVTILTPNECCESLTRSVKKLLFRGNERFATERLSESLWMQSMDNFTVLFQQEFTDEHYALMVTRGHVPSPSQLIVTVMLRVGCNDDDVLKSFLHAMVVQNCFNTIREHQNDRKVTSKLDDKVIISRCKYCVDGIFGDGVLSMEKLTQLGWEGKLHLGYGQWRVEWVEEKKND